MEIPEGLFPASESLPASAALTCRASVEDVQAVLAVELGRLLECHWIPSLLTPEEADEAGRLLAERYALDAWNLGC
jgi:hypothetical protein